MVADTKDQMTKMFNCMNDAFKTAMDAGRRTQESWFKAYGDVASAPANFETFRATSEQMSKEWFPFVERNVEAFTQSCDTGFHTGMDAFKTAFNAALHANEGDFQKNSQEVFDAALNAYKKNVDTMAKAGLSTVDNCTKFVQATCCDAAPTKTAAKANNK